VRRGGGDCGPSQITALCDNVFLARSGSAPDTQLISDYVRHMVAQHVMERDGADADVATVANLCMKLAYNNKGANHGQGLSAAMICAGWDAQRGGQVRGVYIEHPLEGGVIRPIHKPYHTSSAAQRLRRTSSLRGAWQT